MTLRSAANLLGARVVLRRSNSNFLVALHRPEIKTNGKVTNGLPTSRDHARDLSGAHAPLSISFRKKIVKLLPRKRLSFHERAGRRARNISSVETRLTTAKIAKAIV